MPDFKIPMCVYVPVPQAPGLTSLFVTLLTLPTPHTGLYVRQILYHLVTPLAPEPIFEVVSNLESSRPVGSSPHALSQTHCTSRLALHLDLDPKTSGNTEWSGLLIPAGQLWLLGR